MTDEPTPVNFDPRGWTVDSTSGIAIPASAEEWCAFIEAHGLTMPIPSNVNVYP